MLLLLLFASAATAAVVFDTPTYPHAFKTALGDSMYLFWDTVGNEMSFEVHAKASGYVGIGISPSGSMTGADIALGWVKDGKGTLLDMYASANGKPLLDAKQNLKLVHAEETSGITLLHFTRPLDTGDCRNDIPITSDSLRLIWAYSDKDPESNDDLLHHGTKRSVNRVQLLDNPQATSSVQLPNDTRTFDFLMPNVTIPSSKTTLYWCQIIPIPKLEKRHHIVKHARVLDKAPIVHHMIGYSCYFDIANKTLQNIGFDCDNNPAMRAMFKCIEASIGWAVGGEDSVVYPQNVGLPIGGPDDVKFILLEIHYSNDDKKDWIDQSGLRIWFSPTLRQYESGTLLIGSPALMPTIIIPPNSEFTTHTFCPSDCLQAATGNKSIVLRTFSYMLHSHLLGRKLRVRHIRNGEQIGWLGRDEWYDFNQQQRRMFTDHRTILMGDQFLLECVYNSTERKTVTYAGHSTTDEMCLAFLYYYPRIELAACGSQVMPTTQLQMFGNVELNATSYVIKPEKFAGKPFQAMFNQAEWNASTIQQLQNFQSSATHRTYCVSKNGTSFISNTTLFREYPVFKRIVDTPTCQTAVKSSANRLFASLIPTCLLLASSFFFDVPRLDE